MHEKLRTPIGAWIADDLSEGVTLEEHIGLHLVQENPDSRVNQWMERGEVVLNLVEMLLQNNTTRGISIATFMCF